MKRFTIIILFSVIFFLQGCSTNQAQKYKNLESDVAVLCEGSKEDITYIQTKKGTTVKCNGKTFVFEDKSLMSKEDTKLVLGFANLALILKLVL